MRRRSLRHILLAVSLLVLGAERAALAEKRVALVVGIDRYDNLVVSSQLQKARADARAVAATLRALGFEVIAKEDPTRSEFNALWQDFLLKLMPGDTAALAFSGHGVELGGRNYLLPRDVPNIRPGREELLRRESLSLQEFLADLREKGTRLNLVVIDACRDNPFEQAAGRSVGGTRGLAVTEPPEGTFIMFSAGTGESALDRLSDADRDPNSVYMRLLLPLLSTPGLPLETVAGQVRVAVRNLAATVPHRQTPAYYNQVIGTVCLAGGDCGLRPAVAPTPQQSAAAEAWPTARDSGSIAALEAFVRRFGDGYWGDLARQKLNELREAEATKQRVPAEQRVAADTKAKAEAAEKERGAETPGTEHGNNNGWSYLGGLQPKSFPIKPQGLGYETGTVSVHRNRGFKYIRLDVKHRGITLNTLTLVYEDNGKETVKIGQFIEAGGSYLLGESGRLPTLSLKPKPIKEMEVSYRSRTLDKTASEYNSFVEFWAR